MTETQEDQNYEDINSADEIDSEVSSGFASLKGGGDVREDTFRRIVDLHDFVSFQTECEKHQDIKRDEYKQLMLRAISCKSDRIVGNILSIMAYPVSNSKITNKDVFYNVWRKIIRQGMSGQFVNCLRIGLVKSFIEVSDISDALRVASKRHHRGLLKQLFEKVYDEFKLEKDELNMISPFTSYTLESFRNDITERIFSAIVQRHGIYGALFYAAQHFSHLNANTVERNPKSLETQTKQRRRGGKHCLNSEGCRLIPALAIEGVRRREVCKYKQRLRELDLAGEENYMSVCEENDLENIISKTNDSDILDIMEIKIPRELLPCSSCMSIRKLTFIRLLELWAAHKVELREIDSVLIAAIQNKNLLLVVDLICRYKDEIYLCLQQCLETRKEFLQIISKMIEKFFRKKYKKMFDYLRVYPSWETHDKIVLVAIYGYGGKTYTGMPSKYHHIKIFWRNITTIRERHLEERVSREDTARKCIDENVAAELFENHSNLNKISLSGYKIRRRRRTAKLCVVLYCSYKKFVPLGEDQFPRMIQGMRTDIREGINILTGGTTCHMGEQITANPTGHATCTLGGFVVKNNDVYILTCSHALFTPSDLCSDNVCLQRKAIATANGNEVGTLMCASFSHGKANEISVDAALIKVKPDVDYDGLLPFEGTNLAHIGIPADFPLVYEDGLVCSYDECIRGRTFVKRGSETGITKCAPPLTGCHIRISTMPLLLHDAVNQCVNTLSEEVMDTDEVPFSITSPAGHVIPDSREFVMYHQLEIDFSHEDVAFSSIGDSGALVFTPNDIEKLSCVGMLIGISLNKTAFLTPIQAILTRMDMFLNTNGQPLKMKSFQRNGGRADNQSNASASGNSQAQPIDLVSQIKLLLDKSEERTLQQISGMRDDLNERIGLLEVNQISIKHSLDTLTTDVSRIKKSEDDKEEG